jgi:hypothetical protein
MTIQDDDNCAKRKLMDGCIDSKEGGQMLMTRILGDRGL